jgi:ribosomal protein S18 acetylase RimI-like enzyme
MCEDLPPAQLVVRRAGAADVDTVAAIADATYRDHFAHIWSPAGLEEYLAREVGREVVAAEIAGGRCRFLLAERDGGAIGFAKLRWPRPLPRDGARVGVELQKLYLRAAQVRGGAGARLMDEVVAETRALGFALLWLDVLVRNARARAFYERHGFAVVGEDLVPTDLEPERLWVMARAV